MIKEFIKHSIGFYRAMINGIVTRHEIYIGRDVNISGGRNIKLGSQVVIRPHSDIWCNSGMIVIDDGSEIGERDRISIANKLYIGKKVLISPNVYITDCDHEYRNIEIATIDQGIVTNNNEVSIGEGTYIGINSVIVGNVNIGKHSVVGANSVVTKDVEDYTIVAGVPAIPIRKYNHQSKQWERV